MYDFFSNKYAFIFVLARISFILAFSVFWGDKRILKSIKVGFIVLVSMLVTPTLELNLPSELSTAEFSSILILECFIGFSIGYVSNLIVNILQMAGSLIDVQGGFSMAQVFDPTTQSQVTLVSQFLMLVGMLFFILNDFHVEFLEIIIDSFTFIPIGSTLEVSSIISLVIKGIGIAVCIALPVIGVIFVIDIILGISAKTMPQLNLFSVGYIVKIFVTLILMYVYILVINKFVIYITELVFKFLLTL